MSKFTLRVVAVLLALLGTISATTETAHGGMVEAPDRHVARVHVTYTEHSPTARFAARTYFETSDGAAYRFVTYGSCTRSGLVPRRVCRTVFWYAR